MIIYGISNMIINKRNTTISSLVELGEYLNINYLKKDVKVLDANVVVESNSTYIKILINLPKSEIIDVDDYKKSYNYSYDALKYLSNFTIEKEDILYIEPAFNMCITKKFMRTIYAKMTSDIYIIEDNVNKDNVIILVSTTVPAKLNCDAIMK